MTTGELSSLCDARDPSPLEGLAIYHLGLAKKLQDYADGALPLTPRAALMLMKDAGEALEGCARATIRSERGN